MKRLVLLFVAILPFVMSAQSIKEEVELFQSIYGMEKKAVMADFTKVTNESNEEFWMLYDEYEDQRKVLGQERIALLVDYAENYTSLSDEKLDYLVAANLKSRASLDGLMKKYHKKIKKVSGSKVAAQFIQLEASFLSLTRAELMKNTPLVGEYDN